MPSCHANLQFIDVRVKYEHSKGRILILPNITTLLVTNKYIKRRDGITSNRTLGGQLSKQANPANVLLSKWFDKEMIHITL